MVKYSADIITEHAGESGSIEKIGECAKLKEIIDTYLKDNAKFLNREGNHLQEIEFYSFPNDVKAIVYSEGAFVAASWFQISLESTNKKSVDDIKKEIISLIDKADLSELEYSITSIKS